MTIGKVQISKNHGEKGDKFRLLNIKNFYYLKKCVKRVERQGKPEQRKIQKLHIFDKALDPIIRKEVLQVN